MQERDVIWFSFSKESSVKELVSEKVDEVNLSQREGEVPIEAWTGSEAYFFRYKGSIFSTACKQVF